MPIGHADCRAHAKRVRAFLWKAKRDLAKGNCETAYDALDEAVSSLGHFSTCNMLTEGAYRNQETLENAALAVQDRILRKCGMLRR